MITSVSTVPTARLVACDKGAPARSKSAVSLRLAAAACCAIACALGAAGCAGDKAQIEGLALDFVDAIEHQDSDKLEVIIDWERYYSYRDDVGSGDDEFGPEDVETQKTLLLKILGADRGLALRYLTAEHTIERIVIDGDEASAEVLQVDRASNEKRLITLLMARNDGWKIYRFSTEELDGD